MWCMEIDLWREHKSVLHMIFLELEGNLEYASIIDDYFVDGDSVARVW